MGNKHTPGPWYQLSGGFITNSVLLGWAGEDHYVCSVGHQKHAEANARLIAAAPELLEACKAACQCLIEIGNVEHKAKETYNQLKQAIAEATK